MIQNTFTQQFNELSTNQNYFCLEHTVCKKCTDIESTDESKEKEPFIKNKKDSAKTGKNASATISPKKYMFIFVM